MKKLLVIALAIVMISTLIIGACAAPAPTPGPAPAPSPAPAPGPTAAEPIVLKVASWAPTAMPPPIDWDPNDFMIQEWMKTVEEETGGRVKFDYYPSETLVKVPETWDALRAGVCDIAIPQSAWSPGQFPLWSSLALPGLFPNSRVASLTCYKLLEEGYAASEWEDIKCLWINTIHPADIGCSARPIHKLEDFKGLKVAIAGEPETSTIKALGAVPVGMGVFDMYIALERGTVDAVWVELSAQVAFKWYEVCKYWTGAQAGGARTVEFCMNNDSYNRLPPDIQKVFDKNSGLLWSLYFSTRFDRHFDICEAYLDDYAKAKGYEGIYYPPKEEIDRWDKAWEPVWESWIAEKEDMGLPARKMLDRCRELVERYSGYLKL